MTKAGGKEERSGEEMRGRKETKTEEVRWRQEEVKDEVSRKKVWRGERGPRGRGEQEWRRDEWV